MGDVVDYSWARPKPADLRARGYTGAMRYLSYERGKNLSIPERDALWAADIAIGLVWETTANRPLDGFSAGRADAVEANRQADGLGWPDWVPIAYAVDFDPTGKLGPIEQYFRGVLSAGGRPVGDYGAYAVIEHLAGIEHAGRRVECHWQCAGWSGFGSGSGGAQPLDAGKPRRRSRHACLYQDIAETRRAGEDHNHVLGHVAFLFHPDQTPEDAPVPEEDDMPVETHIWVTKPGSKWFEDHGGEPGKQAMFKALNTDQFVRVMAPVEVDGHNNLHRFIEGAGGKSGLKVDGEVDDWVFSDRTLLPREWPAPNAPAPVIVSLTPEQVTDITLRLIDALGIDPEELAELTADVLADRLDN